MNKKLVVCSCLIFGLSSMIFSPAAISNNVQERGYISVNTSDNMEITPDIAEISFAVKTNDEKSLQKATNENRIISDKVLTELKSIIDTTKGDYVKTSDYNASPIYSYKDSKRYLEKYEVSNKVVVHTKSIDKLGVMIDKAIASGATNVDSLNFSVSNYDRQCNELLAKASEKAKVRANVISKALSTSLDGIRSFDSSCSANNYSTPRFYMAKNMLAATADAVSEASGGATSISNGVIKINANVNATFFVK